MNKQQKILLGGLMLSLVLPALAFAEVLNDGSAGQSDCLRLQTPLLKYRATDARTNGEVSAVQDFLITKGLLSGTTSGFYGKLTVEAVKKYQGQFGFEKTGNVGALTGSKIAAETCSGAGAASTLPTPTPVTPGTSLPVPAPQTPSIDRDALQKKINELMDELARRRKDPTPTTAVTLSSVSGACDVTPSETRYKVTLTGTGFYGMDQIWTDGKGDGLERVANVWEKTNTSLSYYLPWRAGNYYDRNIWLTYGVGQKSNVKTLFVDMRGTCSPSPVSKLPVVQVLGTPTLDLGYDGANKESVLTASFPVKITAGNLPLSSAVFGGVSPLGVTFYQSNYESRPVYGVVMGRTNCPAVINAGAVETCTISATVEAGKLFAGQYWAHINPEIYVSNGRGGADNFLTASISGTQSTRLVTIIGERAPWLSRVTNDATPNVNVSLFGERFSPSQNLVSLNGVTKVLPAIIPSGSSQYINFQLTDFNVTAAGVYTIQVKTADGASNILMANITNAPSGQSTSASIMMLEKPTIALEYDSAHKETVLSARFHFKLTAGSQKISGNYWGGASPVSVKFNGPGVVQNFSLSLLSGASYVSPNSSSEFEFTAKANPNELISGAYSAELVGSVFQPDLSTYAKADIGGDYQAAPIVIVGERAPFLSGAMIDSCTTCNLAVIISGVRFDAASNYVRVGNTTAMFPSTDGGTKIYVPVKGYDFVAGGSYPVTVSTSEGLSNMVYTYTKG